MSNTRREFLQTTAALAVGSMMGGVPTTLAAESAATKPAGNQGASAQSAEPSGRDTLVQVPKMKFGNAEISRLVLGFMGGHITTTISVKR